MELHDIHWTHFHPFVADCFVFFPQGNCRKYAESLKDEKGAASQLVDSFTTSFCSFSMAAVFDKDEFHFFSFAQSSGW